MADVNKSIEISYKADLKQLLQNLKKMPGVTEKEAKEMVKGLQTQLRQAEKAAQKASANSSKAFDKMSASAKRTTINARSLRREFANIDRLTSEASQGLALISPSLGDAAAQASVAASGVESLGRALSVSNPLFIIGAVVVGGLIAAFTANAKQAEALEESEKRLNETLEKSIADFENLEEAAKNADSGFGDLISSTNDLRNELLVMQGQITELELQSLQNLQDIYDFEQQLRANAKERLNVENDTLKNIQERHKAIQAEIKLLDESRSYFSFNADINAKQNALKKESLQLSLQAKDIEKGITDLQKTQQNDIARAVEEREKVIEALQEEKERQAEIKAQEERRKRIAREAREAEKERNAILKEQQEIYDSINDSLKKSQKTQETAREKLLDMIAKQEGKEADLQRKLDKQVEAIDAQIKAARERLEIAQLKATTDEQEIVTQELLRSTLDEINALEDLRHETKMQQEKELQDLRNQNAEQEKKNIRERQMLEFQNWTDLTAGTLNALSAVHEARVAMGRASEKELVRAFKLNQLASLANVAFAVAEGLAKSAGQPIRTAAVIAAGVASTAKIFAQKPPTADMGMIGNNDTLRPDETTTRVLRGEAVIDRATVNRLGGEQGIRNLQNGMQQGQVVVVQPFKHFDRFIKGINMQPSMPVKY